MALRSLYTACLLAVALSEVAIHPTAEIACCACKFYSKTDPNTRCRSGSCQSWSRSSLGVFTLHGFCWDPVAMNHLRTDKGFGKACADIPHDCDGKDKYHHGEHLPLPATLQPAVQSHLAANPSHGSRRLRQKA
jgi:hypothetical protein